LFQSGHYGLASEIEIKRFGIAAMQKAQEDNPDISMA
jgi:hypothetical protein